MLEGQHPSANGIAASALPVQSPGERTIASLLFLVPNVNTSPAYGCLAVGLGGLVAASWLIGQAGGGRLGNCAVEVVGMGGWSGGSDEIIVAESCETNERPAQLLASVARMRSELDSGWEKLATPGARSSARGCSEWS